MNILFAVVVAASLISGCGYSKKQIKLMVDESVSERRLATRVDLKSLEKKIKDQRKRAIKYHKRNWPHGCEEACK